MKNLLNKVFSSKKINIPFFAAILVLQVLIAILSMLGGERHIIILANALLILCLVVAIFLTNHFKKYKAERVLITIMFFIQAIINTAYSFQSYPKAPSANANFASFIFYIIYACSFFALFICAIILHVGLSKQHNANTLFASYITFIVMFVISLALIIGCIVNLAKGGYSHMLLCDIWTTISFDLIAMYLLTNETIMLPTIEKSAK